MDLELHQLELRHADLRIREPGRYRRLLASLAEQGQQVPVVVIAEQAPEQARYVVIDGYLRVAALAQLGQDTVQATVWPESETEALVHHHHLSGSSCSAFEEAWFLAWLHEQGMTPEEMARRLCRSRSWVSRRLALVKVLPQIAQDKVRQGIIPPHAAMKYLVPLARANRQQCETLVTALGTTRLSEREFGTLYAGWRRADALGRQRLCENPLLFLRSVLVDADKKGGKDKDEPGTALLADLATLSSAAYRARKRILEEGLCLYATHRGRDLHAAWHAAREAFDVLCSVLLEAMDNARPIHPDRHPQAP